MDQVRLHPAHGNLITTALQHRYAEAVSVELGWHPEVGRFHLFSVDIGSVAYLRYEDPTGDQHVELWPDGKQFVRRGTSATSLGEPERSAIGFMSE